MCSGRRSASSVLGAPAQPLFHGANARRTTALGRDRCPGHDRSCRAQHVPRRLQTRCATRPLAPSLSWRFAEGFNDSPTRRRQPTTAMAVEPDCSQLFHDGSYWRILTFRIASLEVRKGRSPSSNDAICAFETFERRLVSTYCGRSRPRSWTPQLGGYRAYGCPLRKDRSPRHSSHSTAATSGRPYRGQESF
jgi:hypothetical protein